MLRQLAFVLIILALLSGCSSVGPSTSPDLTLADALGQLQALPAPEGANPQHFAELKDALSRALQNSGRQKFTAAVPTGASGAVADLTLTVQGGSNIKLDWTYRNKGDYDQNRQVTISDLSTLGANLTKTPASPDWLTKAIAADGDSNGEINVSDITPIGANLQATVGGYKVQSTATPANEASWSEVADIAFDTSSIPGGSALRRFTHTLAATPQAWYRVVAYDAGEVGAGSNEVQYALSAPSIVSVAPLSGEAGAGVTFTAVLAGGTPSSRAWDFGGGAVPNTSALPSPAVTLAAEGVYNASLTVSNAAGSDTFDFTLTVSNPPAPVIDDVQPQSGVEWSEVVFTATLSGGPVATYAWDFGGGATPNTDATVAPFVTLGTAGIYPASLTVTNAGGSDTFNFNLTVTPGINNPPTASFTATPQTGNPGDPVVLDASGSTDSDGTIAKYEWDLDGDGSFEVDNGTDPTANMMLPNPAGTVDVGLRVTDDDGETDTETVTLSSEDVLSGTWSVIDVRADSTLGRVPVIALVDGRPAIAYGDDTNEDLLYSIADTADGLGTWTNVTVDDSGDVQSGDFRSLAVINGKPAISYTTDMANEQMYAYCSMADGTSGWNTVVIDSARQINNQSSLALVAGYPAVAYQDKGNEDLRYAYSNTSDGSSGWTTILVDGSTSVTGYWPSLAVINGSPAIAYAAHSLVGGNGDLYYAYSSTPDGSSGWNVVTAELGNDVGRRPTLLLADGRPAIVSLNADLGSLSFAYSSTVDGSGGWNSLLADNSGDVSQNMCGAIVAGRPAVAYPVNADDTALFAVSDSADGTGSWTISTIDSQGAPQISLTTLASGRPAVAMFHQSGLYYATLVP